MAVAAAETLKSDSIINTCCEQWRSKYLKAQESRNALRQAVKFLELKINEIQSLNNHNNNNNKVCDVKIETGERLEEFNAGEPAVNNGLSSFKSQTVTSAHRGCNGDGDENEKVLGLQACIAERDREICRLKELLESEKRRADSKRKRVAETWKLLEQEKNKGAQIAKLKVEKAEGYRVQIGQLEKQVSEAKQKLKSETSVFKAAARRQDFKKRRLFAEKRKAELEMAKANEKLREIEKHKAIEMVKLEEQKALAQDNWNKFVEEKCRADQMSQQLAEDKRTIEDLKRKMLELSSLRNQTEIAVDISAKTQSSQCSKVKHLKNNLNVEKLQTKHTKLKYKLEASRYSILHHKLGCLKIGFVQLLRHFDVLDAYFLSVSGSTQDQAKSLVMLLEGESLSDVTAPCLPAINQLHTEFCTNDSCQLLEGAESIDAIACLLLEEINNCWLQGINQIDLLDSGLMPGNDNVRQRSNEEVVQHSTDKNNDVSGCLKRCLVSDTRPHALKNVILCHLIDIVSLVELVANEMSWHWTDIKLVPLLLDLLDTCVEEKIAVAIIVLLGKLGRIGVDNGGYGDQGAEKLRCNLFAYLCRISSTKAGFSLQIATAN